MHSKDLAEPLSGRAFYLQGEDFYWLDNANRFFIDKIDEKLLDVSMKVFSKLDSLADIIYPLSSFGFGDGNQLIIVKDGAYDAKKDELHILRGILSEDIEPYYLVFENVKFLTAAEKKLMTEVSCARLEKAELLVIIADLFHNAGGIDRGAASLIADYAQNDMSRIALECQKLLSYAEGGRVTEAMVDELVSEDSELQVYQFINCISEGRRDKALRLLDRLISRGESRSFILAALLRQYRRMLHSALSPKSDAELAALFGVKEYAIKKARQSGMGGLKLKGIVDMLVGYEYKFKSGRMSEAAAFDAVVARLLAA